MKNFCSKLILLIAIYLLTINSGYSQVRILGKAHSFDEGGLITAKLFKNGSVDEEWTLKKSGKFARVLDFGNVYKIEFSKPLHYTTIIGVDTRFPEDKLDKHTYAEFDADVELLEHIEGIDAKILEKPIMEIQYYKDEDKFDFDREHLSFVQRYMEELHRVSDSLKLAGHGKVDSELAQDIAGAKMGDATAMENRFNLLGMFYNGSDVLANTSISLFNSDMEELYNGNTDEKGAFFIKNLELKKDYTLRLNNIEESKKYTSDLKVVKTIDEVFYEIFRLKNGDFTFRALKQDESTIANDDLSDVDMIDYVGVEGVVYRKLLGDAGEVLQVFIQDETTLLIDSVNTNEHGKFTYNLLNPGHNYTFSTNSKDVGFIDLITDGKVVSHMQADEKGNFTYNKLTYEIANMSELINEDVKLNDNMIDFEGQLFKKKAGDMDKTCAVHLYDEGGKIIKSTYTDKSGMFKFKNLRKDLNYFFDFENSEDVKMLDLINNTSTEKVGNNKIAYSYKKASTVTIDDINDIVILFDYNKSDLNKIAKTEVDKELNKLKASDDKIEIAAFTDNRGGHSYNERLSNSRAKSVENYLVSNGINKSRITLKYHGELKPVVDCSSVDCSEAEHQKNRRAVVSLKR